MSAPSLYAACVPVCQAYLGRLRGWLLAAQGAGLSGDARLAPDMHPLASQAAIACNFALRACFAAAGLPVPAYGGFADDFAGLVARVDHAQALLATLTPQPFEGREAAAVEDQAGQALVQLPAAEFLCQYALPNFFFHLTLAYALLRQQGLALGKADFDGLHRYGPP